LVRGIEEVTGHGVSKHTLAINERFMDSIIKTLFSLSLSADFARITARADAADVATKKLFGSRHFLLSQYA
jgi:hypothetical protein